MKKYLDLPLEWKIEVLLVSIGAGVMLWYGYKVSMAVWLKYLT